MPAWVIPGVVGGLTGWTLRGGSNTLANLVPLAALGVGVWWIMRR